MDFAELQTDLASVERIKDLIDYLDKYQTPAVAEVIKRALGYFAYQDEKDFLKNYWQVVKHQEAGWMYNLTADTLLNRQLVRALKNWLVRPDLGGLLHSDDDSFNSAFNILHVLSKRFQK